MKKNVDGINDEYEAPSPLPQIPLDSDDAEDAEDPDAPFDDALDIMGGSLDIFEKSGADNVPFECPIDMTEEKYDVFSLSENDDKAIESAVDLTAGQTSELFPLKSGTERDHIIKNGDVGDFVTPRAPVKKKKRLRGGVIASAAVCSILIFFLIWTLIGTVYTNKYNAYIYNEFLRGADVEYTNPDFIFFMTVDGKTLPVIKSDTPKYYVTFNGNLFPPGTLTSSDGNAITGSPKLLPAFDSDITGTVLIIESRGQKSEYEVCSLGDYDPQESYDTPTVFIEDKSSATGYTAIFTQKITASN